MERVFWEKLLVVLVVVLLVGPRRSVGSSASCLFGRQSVSSSAEREARGKMM